ncbi:MAG TPA: HAD-IC family P-type ATPase [Steroidobacteraceae bacterium]|nr:HAD-IC family P-type ATPase [Steroidobacteraceae bacterium]
MARLRPPAAAHAVQPPELLAALRTSEHGLTQEEVAARLRSLGRNALPHVEPPGLGATFVAQFKSPLIYVLLAAALVSLLVGEWTSAAFIFAVLLLNAGIGAYQEYSAEQAAEALRDLVILRSHVIRAGDVREVDSQELVLGDLVLLESGSKVPADLRLLDSHNLTLDESLLTGESLPVTKDAHARVSPDSPLAERPTMAFAGTLVATGRSRGVVVGTGLDTQLGLIAETVFGRQAARPPLLERMDRFTRFIGVVVAGAAIALAGIELGRGSPPVDIFLVAVALAVSAIPEGLPVALTVALATGMRRMARRSVIVRRLIAVESLGSCTFIVSDKTGTLTVNQLTAREVQLPDQPPWQVTGEGLSPDGTLVLPPGADPLPRQSMFERLCRAAVLANEAVLSRSDGKWRGEGDPVDLALLVLAHKAGITQPEALAAAPQIAAVPYEPEARFAASLNRTATGSWAMVKGAAETLLEMCARAATLDGELPLQKAAIEAHARALAAEGHRVLAVADGPVSLAANGVFSREHLSGLCFLGLVAMADPLREEAREAIDRCHRAGIEVAMVTGDHPATAFTIGRQLGLVKEADQVVTGPELRESARHGQHTFDERVRDGRVFARTEPQQKLEIVLALQRAGHFVAVTGDGVNDAPALRAAQVGVAMGRSGTDVARESSDLVITDDNFASIVSGIEEGRVAYANVRKVIFLLISTGAAEIVLFALSLALGLPLPLTAIQLLWLNLVTNGIQGVALAFEPAEGHELQRRPRPPREPIFNRLMLERVLLSAAVIGGVAFGAYHWMLAHGYDLAQARNATLLLVVLFENVQAFNSRSETLSVFGHDPMRNRLLLFGTLLAQLIHIAAMHAPGVQQLLEVRPVSLAEWAALLALALLILVVSELHKICRGRLSRRGAPHA